MMSARQLRLVIQQCLDVGVDVVRCGIHFKVDLRQCVRISVGRRLFAGRVEPLADASAVLSAANSSRPVPVSAEGRLTGMPLSNS
jgi:hypothetical protein